MLAMEQEIIEADCKAEEPVKTLLNELYREVPNVSVGSLKNHLTYDTNVVMLVKNSVAKMVQGQLSQLLAKE